MGGLWVWAAGRRGRRMAAIAAGVLAMALMAAGQQRPSVPLGGPAAAVAQQGAVPPPQYGVAPAIHLPPAMAYHQKKERAALRQRKLKEASAKLFLLAQQLRVTVGKTDENTLSLAVIRKAKAIEKLAKQIQDIMARGTD